MSLLWICTNKLNYENIKIKLWAEVISKVEVEEEVLQEEAEEVEEVEDLNNHKVLLNMLNHLPHSLM